MWPVDFSPALSADADSASDIVFAFHGEQILLTNEGKLPGVASLSGLLAPLAGLVFGKQNGQACRTLRWSLDTPLPEGLQSINLRTAFGLLDDSQWFLAARAKHLHSWDHASQYCGVCASPTHLAPDEPAKVCSACGQRYYPQIAPAVMCLVRKGDELLLARSPHFREGIYSALAGFVEAGESVEACVHREVFEETGIRICNLRWFASQPWPFPQSLMLAFHADYASGEITPQPGEIEDAQWFGLDRLPGLPAPVSIASQLIADGIRQISP